MSTEASATAATERPTNPSSWIFRACGATYRYLRSIATWEAEGLCRAIERWSRESEMDKGAWR